jgi:hypothetical protein
LALDGKKKAGGGYERKIVDVKLVEVIEVSQWPRVLLVVDDERASMCEVSTGTLIPPLRQGPKTSSTQEYSGKWIDIAQVGGFPGWQGSWMACPVSVYSHLLNSLLRPHPGTAVDKEVLDNDLSSINDFVSGSCDCRGGQPNRPPAGAPLRSRSC